MPVYVAAAATVIGAGISAYSASSTADKQAASVKAGQQSADARFAEQNARIDVARGQLQPWVDTGLTGYNALADVTGLRGPDAAKTAMDGFTASPGYGFRFKEGLRAVDAGAASKGILRSGATLKAETDFGQGLASQEFGNYIGTLNKLAGFGQNATGQQANLLSQQGTNTNAAASNDQGAATNLASIYGAEGAATNQAIQKGISNALAAYGTYSGSVPGQAAPSSYYNSANYPIPAVTGGNVEGFY